MDKYKDEDAVKDLISRKTADGLWEPNPDFPDREDTIFILVSDSFPKVIIYNVSTLIFRLAIPSHHSARRSTAPIGPGSPRRRQTVMPGSIRLPPGGLEVWMAVLLLL